MALHSLCRALSSLPSPCAPQLVLQPRLCPLQVAFAPRGAGVAEKQGSGFPGVQRVPEDSAPLQGSLEMPALSPGIVKNLGTVSKAKECPTHGPPEPLPFWKENKAEKGEIRLLPACRAVGSWAPSRRPL